MIFLEGISGNIAVEQLFRDLRHKSAHGIILHFSAQHSGPGTGERKIVFGPCDADVGKAALLLFRFFVTAVESHSAGEYAVFHACNIYMGEFQPLGAVQSHEKNFVLGIACVVKIRYQGHFFQKSGQCRLFRCLLVIRDLTDQFVDVGDPVFTVLVIKVAQIRFIIGLYDDLAQEF